MLARDLALVGMDRAGGGEISPEQLEEEEDVPERRWR